MPQTFIELYFCMPPYPVLEQPRNGAEGDKIWLINIVIVVNGKTEFHFLTKGFYRILDYEVNLPGWFFHLSL